MKDLAALLGLAGFLGTDLPPMVEKRPSKTPRGRSRDTNRFRLQNGHSVYAFWLPPSSTAVERHRAKLDRRGGMTGKQVRKARKKATKARLRQESA